MAGRPTLQAVIEPRSDPDGNFAAKTYNYLRIGMLVAAAALGYSIVEEYSQPGVHTALGSISGYYYTPARPIFVSAMVAIGFALIVIKGRTPLEDAFLTLAGIMAPIVAFIPTSDDTSGVGREAMLKIGHYQPGPEHDSFVAASKNNNLHAFVFAGSIAIVLALIAFLIEWHKTDSSARFNPGTWMGIAAGFALALFGWVLLHDYYWWVEDGHALAACAMFAFLALAAIANSVLGFFPGLMTRQMRTNKWYAGAYGFVGLAMIVFGTLFVVYRRHHRDSFGGRLVLIIEVIEISLFVIFWAVQTVERWNRTV